ncbi:hypothetical protein ACA910_021868 [Epithemia clementina (nom. ined.)]
MSRSNICRLVRDSCTRWMQQAQGGSGGKKGCDLLVKIHADAVLAVAQRIQQQQAKQVVWDEENWHYQAPASWPDRLRHERMALYILALDAINFCFWPPSTTVGYEYVDLACTLTSMASADHEEQEQLLEKTTESESPSLLSLSFLLSASRLENMTVEEMQQLFVAHDKEGKCPTDMEHRCALWNELGQVLCQKYQGSALQLVESAQGSAVQLVQLLYDEFPGFRDVVHVPNHEGSNDCSNSNSAQTETAAQETTTTVYFLKRAQICVGDLQAALSLSLTDTDQLTTFADYRLPQLLRHWNVLEYVDDDLRQAVDDQVELPVASRAEISIRAATVVVVEQLVHHLQQLQQLRQQEQQQEQQESTATTTTENGLSKPPPPSNESKTMITWNAVQVDWYLWQVGERMDSLGELKPHHRVRTIYY